MANTGYGEGQLTAGLNKPPEIRKKTHTFTIREKPKTRAMYNKTSGLKPVSPPVVED
jgi:hypothetical protein